MRRLNYLTTQNTAMAVDIQGLRNALGRHRSHAHRCADILRLFVEALDGDFPDEEFDARIAFALKRARHVLNNRAWVVVAPVDGGKVGQP